MIRKFNKRTIILVLIIILFTVLIVVDTVKNNYQNVEQKKKADYQEYLDNGIEISEYIEEKKYLERIPIRNIVFNNDHIEYNIENSSDSSVYLSNQITIIVGEDSYSLYDKIDGKIELKPFEKKTIIIDCTINQLSKKLGYRVDTDTMQISMVKPIYIKYDDSTLLGVAKGDFK